MLDEPVTAVHNIPFVQLPTHPNMTTTSITRQQRLQIQQREIEQPTETTDTPNEDAQTIKDMHVHSQFGWSVGWLVG